MTMYDILLDPRRIGKLVLKNKLIMDPLGTRYGDFRGPVTEKYLSFLK
jgi:hypothetical protein